MCRYNFSHYCRRQFILSRRCHRTVLLLQYVTCNICTNELSDTTRKFIGGWCLSVQQLGVICINKYTLLPHAHMHNIFLSMIVLLACLLIVDGDQWIPRTTIVKDMKMWFYQVKACFKEFTCKRKSMLKAIARLQKMYTWTESHMDRKLYGMDELLRQPMESSNQALREKSHLTSKLRQTL